MPDGQDARSAASVLEKVRDRARNLSSVFPYQRRGEALYLDPADWKVLADELDRLLRAET